MKSVWLPRFIALALWLPTFPEVRAQALPPAGAGVDLTVQMEVQPGPILSTPPPLPVPVLPGSRVRFTLTGLAPSQIRDTSWSKDAVNLNLYGNELQLNGVSENDTGRYLATVTTLDGEVITTARVLHVAAFPRQRLLNISTRARISSDGPTVIAGFVVDAGPRDASSSKRLLIRAVGPSLQDYGVRDALVDPTLRLFRSDGSILEVAEILRDPVVIMEAGIRTGAAPLRPGAADAGIVISLRGGVYTAHVNSASNHAGEVMVEIYEIPE